METKISKRDESVNIGVVDGQLVITVGLDCLFHALQASSLWLTHDNGVPVQVLDKELFLSDLIRELEREDELGSTMIHKALDDAANGVFESGSESFELPKTMAELEGDDDGSFGAICPHCQHNQFKDEGEFYAHIETHPAPGARHD